MARFSLRYRPGATNSQTWRGDDREGDERRAEERHPQIGEERLVQRRVDQPPVRRRGCSQDLGQRLDQEGVDRRGEVVADDEADR